MAQGKEAKLLLFQLLGLYSNIIRDHQEYDDYSAQADLVELLVRDMLHKRGLRFYKEDPSDRCYDAYSKKRGQGKLLLFQKTYNRPEEFEYYQRQEHIIHKVYDRIT